MLYSPKLKAKLNSNILEKKTFHDARFALTVYFPLSFLLFLNGAYSFYLPLSGLLSLLQFGVASLFLTNGLFSLFRFLWTQSKIRKEEKEEIRKERISLFSSPSLTSSSSFLSSSSSPFPSPISGSLLNTSSFPSPDVSSSSWIYISEKSPNSEILKSYSEEDKKYSNTKGLYEGLRYRIHEGKSLVQLLKDFENKSLHYSGFSDSMENGRMNDFWSPDVSGTPIIPSSSSSFDYSPLLKNYTYQLSTSLPETRSGSTTGTAVGVSASTPMSSSGTGFSTENDVSAPKSPFRPNAQGDNLLGNRINKYPLEIVQWTENLRLWISSTVLRRLVNEIDATNLAISKIGMSDSLIGEASLEKIKKVSQLHSLQNPNIPTLSSIIPFLECTNHQEYLVSRIRELSQGGAMGVYRWNGGGRFKGAEWNDKLISDSEIIIHLISRYFDSRLPPNYDTTDDGTPFSSRYYFKSPDKPDSTKQKINFAIIQSSHKPPYFYLQIGDEEKLHVDVGRNNLFHVLLLFLYYVKTKEDGMLGRINFGLSGINILWVIEDKS